MKRVPSLCGCVQYSELPSNQREAFLQRSGFRSVGKSVGKSKLVANFIGEMADTVGFGLHQWSDLQMLGMPPNYGDLQPLKS